MDSRQVTPNSGIGFLEMLIVFAISAGFALVILTSIKSSNSNMKLTIAANEKLQDNIGQMLNLIKIIRTATSVEEYISTDVAEPKLKVTVQDFKHSPLSSSFRENIDYTFHVSKNCTLAGAYLKPQDPKTCLIVEQKINNNTKKTQINHVANIKWCLPGKNLVSDCDMLEIKIPEMDISQPISPAPPKNFDSMNRLILAMKYVEGSEDKYGKTIYAVIKLNNVTPEESYIQKDVMSIYR